MKSILMAALLTMPLAGCATVPRAPVPVPGVCPDLPAPPDKAINALDAAARLDAEVAGWVIALSQHYDALDVCNRLRP